VNINKLVDENVITYGSNLVFLVNSWKCVEYYMFTLGLHFQFENMKHKLWLIEWLESN